VYPNLSREQWKKFHPSQSEIEAAAHELFRAGTHHGWFRGSQSRYDEMDPIGKEEFEEIVAYILTAAAYARSAMKES
jgi:hypothetical protein